VNGDDVTGNRASQRHQFIQYLQHRSDLNNIVPTTPSENIILVQAIESSIRSLMMLERQPTTKQQLIELTQIRNS
jgi:hypothetical protein